jgi:hypothetical protein
MKTTLATQVVEKFALKLRLPMFIWGAPGVGKSSIVAQIARKNGINLIDLRVVLLDTVDFRGVPSVANGMTKWNVPDFLPTDGKGILFLDELNLAPPLVQSACYQLVLDRKLGDYCLPDGWTVIAAGNRETDHCNVIKMSAALASRFACHITIEPDVKTWTEWGLNNNLHPAVLAFVRMQPNLLHEFDNSSKAFPCPRTWEYLSRYLTTVNGETDLEFEEIVKGIVGKPSILFTRFWKNYRRMPDPMAILKDPIRGWAIPEDATSNADNMHILYAVCMALAKLVDKRTFENMLTFLKRIPIRELQAMGMNDAIINHPELKKTVTYIQWIADNPD